VVFDLTVAVQVGLVLACALFIRKMSSLFSVELVARDGALLQYRLVWRPLLRRGRQDRRSGAGVESGPQEPVVVLDALQLVHLDTSGLDSLRQLHKVVLLRRGTLHLGKPAAPAAGGDRPLGLRRGAGRQSGVRLRCRGSVFLALRAHDRLQKVCARPGSSVGILDFVASLRVLRLLRPGC
jgi:MFS superfamily sulfate permease-like transporter